MTLREGGLQSDLCGCGAFPLFKIWMLATEVWEWALLRTSFPSKV